jgi:prepilin-type N-terminal cleavage/methylation domain-containing protein
MQSRQSTRGITLIELMIVVVIVGILASIAYPNYREFAARAKRTEAKTALLKIATNQERFLLDNNTYTEDLLPLGFSSSPFITETGSYRVRVMPGANVGWPRHQGIKSRDRLLGAHQIDKRCGAPLVALL